MRLTYANCLHRGLGDVLATGEPLVAAGAEGRVIVPDADFEPVEAEQLNQRLWRLGGEWALVEGLDVTALDGVSAADFAAVEATQRVLLPAARGVLEADAILREVTPDVLHTFVASTDDAGYMLVERTVCAAVALTLRARLGALVVEERVSDDPRNAALIEKYRATRNPVSGAIEDARRRQVFAVASGVVNAAARLREPRRRESSLVVEYNPTAVVARRWFGLSGEPLVRSRFTPAEVRPMLRHGERAFALPPARPGSGVARVSRDLQALVADPSPLGERFVVRGVDLAPVVVPALAELALQHAHWVEGRVTATRRRLRRHRVRRVLVPFEAAPSVRVILRAAQAEGIPTAVINDGWKGDDYQTEGMASDHAFALSESVREHYFNRRPDWDEVLVTGDPRNDLLSSSLAWRGDRGDVLVGSFTFSPNDLNCRRGDGERFLDEVLTGIAGSELAARRVTIKLHPADRPEGYTALLARHTGLDVELVSSGDVVEMIPGAAVYISTFSTSLLHAALCGAPFIYYGVNHQNLHPPFRDEPELERRTARTPAELAALLGALEPVVDSSWVERYTGPGDGQNTRRVIDALLRL